jgi:predicted Zn-dependent peptidase
MVDVQQQRNIQRTVLPNGLVVLTERMEHMRSVSMGVWIKTGSRDERPELNGISHFVEHMVFKGTKSRSAQHIAREVDAIGGNLDAFTSKESICFNMKVLDEHIGKALDVLSDLVLHSVFAPEDIQRERGVVLEEIKMDEDNPDTLVHETFVQNLWKNHPLGKPILGTRDTVGRLDQQALLDYYGGRFLGGNVVFSAAGNLEHETLIAMVTEKLSAMPAGEAENDLGRPKSHARITLRQKKSLEQVQLCLGVPAPQTNDDRRYTEFLLNVVLGGGMSSRLFQTVREQRGLAYSIFSEPSSFRDTGSLCVYAGTSARNAEQVVRLTVEEFSRLKNVPVPEEELQRAKDQLKGNVLLGLESTGSRMSNLARQEMYFDRFIGVPEILEKIEWVTSEDIMRMAQELFRPDEVALALLGNLDGVKITRKHLAC